VQTVIPSRWNNGIDDMIFKWVFLLQDHWYFATEPLLCVVERSCAIALCMSNWATAMGVAEISLEQKQSYSSK